MKTVFTTNELPHVFSQQSQIEGRNQTGSLSFYGKRLFTYNVVLAEFISDTEIYFDDRYYSMTTRKHQGHSYSALSQYKIWNYTETNHGAVYGKLKELFESYKKATKPEKYAFIANDLFAKYTEFNKRNKTLSSKEYKKAKRLFSKFSMTDKEREKLKEKERAKKAKIKAERKMEYIEKVDKFLNYKTERINIPYHWEGKYPDALRISKDKTKVETSQGVKIELNDAKALYIAIKKGIDVIGRRISYYRIDKLDNKILKAGCHSISMDYVNKVGKQIIKM